MTTPTPNCNVMYNNEQYYQEKNPLEANIDRSKADATATATLYASISYFIVTIVFTIATYIAWSYSNINTTIIILLCLSVCSFLSSMSNFLTYSYQSSLILVAKESPKIPDCVKLSDSTKMTTFVETK